MPKAKIGQVVYVPVETKRGMFPAEIRFYGEILPGKQVAGWVTETLIVNNKITAQVISVAGDIATLEIPGEVSIGKILEVPISYVEQHASV